MTETFLSTKEMGVWVKTPKAWTLLVSFEGSFPQTDSYLLTMSIHGLFLV